MKAKEMITGDKVIYSVTFVDDSETGYSTTVDDSIKTVRKGDTFDGVTVAEISVESKEQGYPTLTLRGGNDEIVLPDCKVIKYQALLKI